MRCVGKARSAELLEGVMCCTVMAERAEQSSSQTGKATAPICDTEQPLEKDEIRSCGLPSPRDDSRELPEEPLPCAGLLPPCYHGFSSCLSMGWEVFLHRLYVHFAASQRNRALGPLLLSPHPAGRVNRYLCKKYTLLLRGPWERFPDLLMAQMCLGMALREAPLYPCVLAQQAGTSPCLAAPTPFIQLLLSSHKFCHRVMRSVLSSCSAFCVVRGIWEEESGILMPECMHALWMLLQADSFSLPWVREPPLCS